MFLTAMLSGLQACTDAGEPAGGTIDVSVVTAGDGADPDGYQIVLDGLASRAVAGIDSIEFVQVEPGTHRISLLGLAGNCGSSQETSRTVELASQQTLTVDFEVTCRSGTGTVLIQVESSGEDVDPNGYVVLADDQEQGTVEANGTLALELPAGTHFIALSGNTPNCAVPVPKPETHQPRQVARVNLSVACGRSAPAGRGHEILFETDRGGRTEFYIMNDDGTGVRPIPVTPALSLSSPRWSPTGDRIAFVGEDIDFNREIYVLQLGSSAEAFPITSTSFFGARSPTWSPDGSTIAFLASGDANTIEAGIFLVGSDGKGQHQIRTDFEQEIFNLAWSPDGTRIATETEFVGSGGFCGIGLVAADGTSAEQIFGTICGGGGVAWSPDGRKLAYADFDDELNLDIFVRDLAEETTVRLTNSLGADASPSWSPDGKRMAFTSSRDGNIEIYVMNVDGSNQIRITNNPAFDAPPAWRP